VKPPAGPPWSVTDDDDRHPLHCVGGPVVINKSTCGTYFNKCKFKVENKRKERLAWTALEKSQTRHLWSDVG